MGLSDGALDALKKKLKDRGGDHFYNFGCLYFHGNQSFEPCYTQAMDCFKQSAIEFNNIISQFNVGLMYQKGIGVKSDGKEAYTWFRRAAENGYEKAQTYLGCYLLEGVFVKQNYVDALYWLKKAMAQGNAEAYFYASKVYEQGLGVRSDLNTAIEYLKVSARLGFDKAQYEYGELLYKKGSEDPEFHFGYRYLNLAAMQNNLEATFLMATIFLCDASNIYNPKKGLDLLIKAAKQNHIAALYELSDQYRKGRYLSIDKKVATDLFNKALALEQVKAEQDAKKNLVSS